MNAVIESSSATATVRLLIADDDPDFAVVVRHLLRDSGQRFSIGTAVSAAQLLARLEESQWDACLLDHHLPDAPGVDVLRRLGDEAKRRTPMIVVTGDPDPALDEAYLAHGAAGILGKEELSGRGLLRAVRFAMRHAAMVRELADQQRALAERERLAVVGRLATGVAHEYNNLNAVVLANCERLAPALRHDSVKLAIVQRLVDLVARSRRISEGLLVYAGVRQQRPGSCEIGAVVAATVELLRPILSAQSAEVVLPSTGGLAWVAMEAGDLQQVLTNLLINAVHASWARSQRRVRLDVVRGRGGWELVCADDGVGIAQEDLERVFEPFFSRKSGRHADGSFPPHIDGTGLGLPVCKTLVDRAGGAIALRSEPGIGTQVTLRLPEAQPPAPEPADAPQVQLLPVVLLDDNLPLVSLLAEELAERGFAVSGFIDPDEYLRRLPSLGEHCLVLDWQLPGRDGYAVMQAGADPGRVPIPVVLLSGGAPVLPGPVPNGFRLAQILAKPCLASDVATVLKRVARR